MDDRRRQEEEEEEEEEQQQQQQQQQEQEALSYEKKGVLAMSLRISMKVIPVVIIGIKALYCSTVSISYSSSSSSTSSSTSSSSSTKTTSPGQVTPIPSPRSLRTWQRSGWGSLILHLGPPLSHSGCNPNGDATPSECLEWDGFMLETKQTSGATIWSQQSQHLWLLNA